MICFYCAIVTLSLKATYLLTYLLQAAEDRLAGFGLARRRREDAYCDGWTSDSGLATGSGSALLATHRRLLAADVDYACSNAFILLCVETSYTPRPFRRRSRHRSY